jgi:hypothetical protein
LLKGPKVCRDGPLREFVTIRAGERLALRDLDEYSLPDDPQGSTKGARLLLWLLFC